MNPIISGFFTEVQAAAKVVVQSIAGNTPEEKAAATVAFLEPFFNEGLASMNVSPFLDKIADALLELIVKNAITALAS